MKALIIEDEPRARQNMQRILSEHFPHVEPIGFTGSVKESVAWLTEHDGKTAVAPDVIFMDVELADGNCFDIFDRIDINIPVIMTTAYDQYAVHAFEVNSIDYLLKPLEVAAVKRAIDRVAAGEGKKPQRITLRKEKFLIRLNDRIVPVHTRDIAYFYSEAKNSYIVTKTGTTYVLDDSLDAIAECLDTAAFFRISRSCIIAENAIDSVSKLLGGRLRISLKRGIEAFTDLTVSRARVEAFLVWLEN